MSASRSHENIPAGAIRVQNEGDRSDEFKAARERLVTDVNDWLKKLAEVRNRGGLVNGQLVAHQDRITETDLGLTRRGRAMVTEYQAGVSLSGDGTEKPLVFQLVPPHDANGVSEIIEVRGTDPLAVQLHGDARNSDRHREKLAEFGVRQTTTMGRDESRFAFTVYGDGSMKSENLAQGWSNLRAADAEMAQQAFDLIKADVQFAEL
jgi:hypothetical protein